MKKTIVFMLFILVATGYVNSQTVVKLLLPANCSFGTNDVKELKNETDSKFEIFPSPNDGNFTLQVSLVENIGDANIAIYNSLGGLVYSEAVFCNSKNLIKQINLKGLTAGSYIVRFKNNKNELSSKSFIK